MKAVEEPRYEGTPLEPCDQCGAGRNVPCAEGCDEMQDCRSIP